MRLWHFGLHLYGPLKNHVESVGYGFVLPIDYAANGEHCGNHLGCQRAKGLRPELHEMPNTLLKVQVDRLGLRVDQRHALFARFVLGALDAAAQLWEVSGATLAFCAKLKALLLLNEHRLSEVD